jgi:hypothetical protein
MATTKLRTRFNAFTLKFVLAGRKSLLISKAAEHEGHTSRSGIEKSIIDYTIYLVAKLRKLPE